tara:strand:- start:576 stop:1712 length:1137 start_codon:yes stop_codon:yes gene_type:complete
MAIKVSGTTVVDNDRNFNVGVVTATSLDVPPQAISFSPTDGSSDNALNTNIVITYNTDVQKGSGNITLREGSASGTVIQTIAVSSGTVSISGGAVTINPASDLPTGKDIYVVVDDGAFESTSLESGTNLLDTYNFTTGPITTSSFSPTDGATDQSVSTNIVITFSENISKGSGNITLRASSASGTIRQTIDVTSGAVSVSGAQATINPPSDLQYEEDTYVVVDAGCFRNSDGDVASGNAIINTYNFTTESDVPPLGGSYGGGYLICCSSGNLWVVAPSSTEVQRNFYQRSDGVTTANSNAACGDWFVPSITQLNNPGYTCRTHWDSYSSGGNNCAYWSNTELDWEDNNACCIRFNGGYVDFTFKNANNRVRAFRCVSY